MIEILTFRLAEGVDEADFLAADRQLQTAFAYRQPGLLRRTTARSAGGEWVVIDLWRSADDADACDERWSGDGVAARLMSFIDRATVRTARYHTLD